VKIIHFADLHIGVERYSRTDPATGLPSRLLDYLHAFDKLIDYALENGVDLVLFAGDAYQNREPSPTHQREFAKRIRRLVSGGIPIFLLTGNHDLPNALAKATSLEIFDTLAVNRVHVATRPGRHVITTPSGDIQVIALPWLRRSALLSREDTKDLNIDQLNQHLEQVLTDIVSQKAAELNPSLPALLCAHVWVTGAKTGSESGMTIGQEHALLRSNLALPAFDYVALGHIHRQQVLSDPGGKPPVVYAGSLERLDFGEENDDKGFYVVDIDPSLPPGERVTDFRFHKLEGRRFVTIKVSLDASDLTPTETVCAAIAEKQDELPEAIVRLQISLPAELEGQLRDNDIRAALSSSHHHTVAREIHRQTRSRLGEYQAEGITPYQALADYLGTRKGLSEEHRRTLLEAGEQLIREYENR
jgi:DNA repair protein SbcD/Mre11